ncbi:serine hydrolase domain-containing protein [Myroides odoratus]|nr:serine hydrolase domain-containing protein [Myroides odoratus]WQD56245.1 serine hydrolase domain-containing protein [Myroides odoratus]
MTKTYTIAIYTFLLFLSSCTPKTVKQITLNFHKEGKLNGAVLITKKGKIICDTVLGYKNFDKEIILDQNTSFYLASLSKPITAIGVMLMQQDGLLSYEDKASKYIKHLPIYARNITIRQLLNHTSGIPDYEQTLSSSTHRLNNEDVLSFVQQQPGLKFPSNTQFEYSNSGYIILSEIIEAISKQSYSDYIQEKIFTPLQMQHTFVFTNELLYLPDHAIGYNHKKELDDYNLSTTGDGGIYSTTKDLYKLDQALRNNQLLNKSNSLFIYKLPLLKDGTESSYAFGWFVDKKRAVFHTGGLNGFKNLFWRDLDSNTCIIVLTNQGDAFPVYSYLDEIKEVLCK